MDADWMMEVEARREDRERLNGIGPAIYGKNWQTPLASDVGRTARQVRRWAAGDSPIPE